LGAPAATGAPFDEGGRGQPNATPLAAAAAPGRRFRFPARARLVPNGARRWCYALGILHAFELVTQDLGHGAWLELAPRWLAPSAADAYFEALLRDTPWEQGELTLFGRRIPEPRLSAWFGSDDYTYSGRTLRARPFPPPVAELLARLGEFGTTTFNSVLVNLYRNGRDSMGFHSDDEPELGENPEIASISLGATRRFILAPKRKERGARVQLELTHGSLLLMRGSCQREFRHAIPKSASVDAPRINLTFRRILGGAAHSTALLVGGRP
jgi:alkylated DNA repair dioxygenase AlkB